MIAESLALLGRRGRDKVTGFQGIATSVSFDLYGCVQIALSPPMDKEGKVPDGRWFDTNRLDMSSKKIMAAPNFDAKGQTPKTYDNGPAEKPLAASLPPRA